MKNQKQREYEKLTREVRDINDNIERLFKIREHRQIKIDQLDKENEIIVKPD
jgi:hypothetical protein